MLLFEILLLEDLVDLEIDGLDELDNIVLFDDLMDMLCGFLFNIIVGNFEVMDYIVLIILDCMYILNNVFLVRCVDFLEC